ncbi:four helix bundle protein [Fibrobacterota bacterium]
MTYNFSHEKLEVYKLELAFIKWVTPLIAESKKKSNTLTREVCDHLDRASLSALFNTAEGNGKREMPVRARFFDDARGSTAECASCLDALVAKESFREERINDGKALLIRIYNILSKLVEKYNLKVKKPR